jgi:hypothetical protein
VTVNPWEARTDGKVPAGPLGGPWGVPMGFTSHFGGGPAGPRFLMGLASIDGIPKWDSQKGKI